DRATRIAHELRVARRRVAALAELRAEAWAVRARRGRRRGRLIVVAVVFLHLALHPRRGRTGCTAEVRAGCHATDDTVARRRRWTRRLRFGRRLGGLLVCLHLVLRDATTTTASAIARVLRRRLFCIDVVGP